MKPVGPCLSQPVASCSVACSPHGGSSWLQPSILRSGKPEERNFSVLVSSSMLEGDVPVLIDLHWVMLPLNPLIVPEWQNGPMAQGSRAACQSSLCHLAWWWMGGPPKKKPSPINSVTVLSKWAINAFWFDLPPDQSSGNKHPCIVITKQINWHVQVFLKYVLSDFTLWFPEGQRASQDWLL